MKKRLKKKLSRGKIVGKQVRICSRGHKWKIVRYSQHVVGSPFMCGYTKGGLMCPVCHGFARSSYDIPV